MSQTPDASRLHSLLAFQALDSRRQQFITLIVVHRLPKSKAAKLAGLNASREMANSQVATVLAEFFVERKKKPVAQRPEIPGATYEFRDWLRATGRTFFDYVFELEEKEPTHFETKFDEFSDQEWEQRDADEVKRVEAERKLAEKNVIYVARGQHRATRIHKGETHPEGCELCSQEPL
jgi:hypothetical protein